MPAQGDDPERSECELLTVPVVAGEWLLWRSTTSSPDDPNDGVTRDARL